MMLRFLLLPVSSVVQHRSDDKPGLSRRDVLFGTAALAVAGFSFSSSAKERAAETGLRFDAERIYAALDDEPFPIAAVDLKKLSPTFYRQLVDYETSELPGTVIVDTHNRVLYLTQQGGKALRYGIGVGREGFSWSGRGEILLKKTWPTWTPPSEMIKRQPELEQYRDGMPPGPENPLGARALYIYGNENLEAIDFLRYVNRHLYERVPEHTPIVVA